MNNVAIITAGGSGERLKSKIKKQFIRIEDRPILFWTLDKFVDHPQIQKIILVVPKSDFQYAKEILRDEYPKQDIIITSGGFKRQDSVYNALQNCPNNTDLVLIHDGVRPFISNEEISKLIEIAQQKKAVIPIAPTVNTIKEIDGNMVIKTVSRKKLFNVFTPQVFVFTLIKEYSERAKKDKIEVTDDASILEYYDIPVHTLVCSAKNIKITDENDLELSKLIIKNKEII